MKKNEIYRLCLKVGTFENIPTFKIKVGKFEKTINTYFIPDEKQRYNYDLYLERSKEPEILFEVFAKEALIGTGKLKIDPTKNDLTTEIVQIMDKKQKIGAVECSLKKVDKKIKKPPMKINIVQATYTDDAYESNKDGKTQMFIVIKYADNNYKTQATDSPDRSFIWKQQFNIGTADNDRIFLESWKDDGNSSEFIGVSIIDIATKMGGSNQIQVVKDKKKNGVITIQLDEHNSKRPDPGEHKINDKNMVKKRNIKVYAVQAVLKSNAKKGGFIRIQAGDQEFETTPIFQQSSELKWNQSFAIKGVQGEELQAKLCIKDDIEQQLGRCSLKIVDIVNKKYQLAVLDAQDKEIGKMYLQFYDEDLDIRDQVPSPQKKSQKQIEKAEQKPISSETEERIIDKNAQIKSRYANRQSIHDYMAEVNTVLEEGLLKLARNRPEDPIKELGLFLINYKK